MLYSHRKSLRAALLAISYFAFGLVVFSQSVGNSTSVSGTVSDPTGAVIPNAVVEIRNPVSGFQRTVTTDSSGNFFIPNVPFNPYHLTITSKGFAAYAQDVDVRSAVPIMLPVTLKV
jgi:hypothetical protein